MRLAADASLVGTRFVFVRRDGGFLAQDVLTAFTLFLIPSNVSYHIRPLLPLPSSPYLSASVSLRIKETRIFRRPKQAAILIHTQAYNTPLIRIMKNVMMNAPLANMQGCP